MTTELKNRIISSFILLPVSFFFIIKGSFLFIFFLKVCLFITFYEWYNMSKKKKYHLFGYLFLTFAFFSTYILRVNSNESSYILFFIVIITCISTDVGGYIFGKLFQGPKLTKLSPNKTYSGMIGGYILSIITVYFFIDYINSTSKEIYEFNLKIFFFILIISSVSQIGDITVSYFKRLSKIKDTGNLIPGHGGLLDRIDGMIFAFPVSYIIFLLNIIK